jgi:hypothetical protein
MDGTATFTETQRFRQPWLWALTAVPSVAVAVFLGWALYQQVVRGEPFGDQPASDAVLLAIALPSIFVIAFIVWMLYAVRLVTEVRSDGLAVRFWPGRWRHHAYSEIVAFEAVTVRPIRDYGGWGVRFKRGERAYLVNGNRGVRLELADGKRVMIGSQRPDDLLAAIRTWKR